MKKLQWIRRQFVCLNALGVVVFLAFLCLLIVRPSFCPPQPNEWAAQSYQYSSPTDHGTEIRGQILAEKKKSSKAKSANTYEEHKEGLFEVVCGELKVTDLAIVWLTYCLLVLGWYQMRSTDETHKRTERAYIFGGGPFGTTKAEWVEPLANNEVRPEAKYFNDPRRMTIHNYGSTPGFVTRVEWGLIAPERWPGELSVTEAINNLRVPFETVDHPSDVLPPTGTLPTHATYRHVAIDRTENVGKLFFGRIWYRDVFHEMHYSTFKLLLGERFSDPVGDSYWNDWN